MSNTFSHIKNILDKEPISAESKAEIIAFIDQSAKSKEIDDFLIQRLRKNEKITKRFLNVTINELEEKNQELSKYIESNLQLENFAHIASHDLKAPLINIIAFSQLLRTNLDHLNPSPEYKFLENIELSALHMQETIKGLLQFSRASNAKLNIEKFDLEKMLEDLFVDLKGVLEAEKVNIQVINLPNSIHGDRILIKEVFLNLIMNGVKFRKKEAPAAIKISGESHPTEWEFVIRDEGIGIPSEYLEKIFVIFNRLHTTKEYPGTGIGLALCKSIVENHNGKIWVTSELGKSSSFHFTIKK